MAGRDLRLAHYTQGGVRLAVAFLAAAVVLACGGKSEVATPARTLPAATPQSPERQIIIMPVGRAARSDSAEMTIHGVRRSRDEGGARAPEGREWLMVDVTLKNTSTASIDLLMRFLDRDDVDLERADPPGADSFDVPVTPHAEVRGEVAFLAPVGMVGGTIIYGPGEERWAIQMGMFPIDP